MLPLHKHHAPIDAETHLGKDHNFPSKRKDHDYFLNLIVKNIRTFQKCFYHKRHVILGTILGNKTHFWGVSDMEAANIMEAVSKKQAISIEN